MRRSRGYRLLRRSHLRHGLGAVLPLAVALGLGTWGWGNVAASASSIAVSAARPGSATLEPEIPAVTGNGQGNGHTQGSGGVLTSVNWAGYVDTGTTFSSVDGDWVQPTATCPKNQVQQAAFWVGIGGFVQGDPDIEQIGTDSDCLKAKGKHGVGGPNYYAWYQMYPQSLVVLPTSSDPVSPGNSIEASVTVSGANQYTLDITDVGHWTYSTVESQASQPEDASAEWITEAPSSCNGSGKCKVLPLAHFASIADKSDSANGEAISGSGLTDTQINMTSKNGKKLKAKASSLGSGGSSFTVTWDSN